MSNQNEIFLGLSSTAWTAFSSISTFLAVLLALYFPVSEKIGRRKKIYKIIEKEIRNNLSILEKAKDKNNPIYKLVGENASEAVMVTFTLSRINIDYWEENKQFISETSIKKYNEYNDINTELKELKLFSQELLAIPVDFSRLNNIIIALNKVYLKLKKIDKYW